MIIRPVTNQERDAFDAVVTHPLQTWAWGEFRHATGVKVIRLGVYEKSTLIHGITFTVHPLPYKIPGMGTRSIMYCPRSHIPSSELLLAMQEHALENHATFIKFEPDFAIPVSEDFNTRDSQLVNFLDQPQIQPGRELFTRYNFWLDLSPTEEQLLANMKPKTRYNIRVAQKHGVEVVEDNSEQAFEVYLDLTNETTNRQGFHAHTRGYHQLMWKYMREANIAHLLTARYQGEIITTWVLFIWKNKLYYPYGASSRRFKEVMANNLVMWKAIQFGKQHGLRTFDMWGTAGINPQPTDSWYGFHRFKEGFNPQMVKYIGTYDYVINSTSYNLMLKLDEYRRKLLRWQAKLGLRKSF